MARGQKKNKNSKSGNANSNNRVLTLDVRTGSLDQQTQKASRSKRRRQRLLSKAKGYVNIVNQSDIPNATTDGQIPNPADPRTKNRLLGRTATGGMWAFNALHPNAEGGGCPCKIPDGAASDSCALVRRDDFNIEKPVDLNVDYWTVVGVQFPFLKRNLIYVCGDPALMTQENIANAIEIGLNSGNLANWPTWYRQNVPPVPDPAFTTPAAVVFNTTSGGVGEYLLQAQDADGNALTLSNIAGREVDENSYRLVFDADVYEGNNIVQRGFLQNDETGNSYFTDDADATFTIPAGATGVVEPFQRASAGTIKFKTSSTKTTKTHLTKLTPLTSPLYVTVCRDTIMDSDDLNQLLPEDRLFKTIRRVFLGITTTFDCNLIESKGRITSAQFQMISDTRDAHIATTDGDDTYEYFNYSHPPYTTSELVQQDLLNRRAEAVTGEYAPFRPWQPVIDFVPASSAKPILNVPFGLLEDNVTNIWFNSWGSYVTRWDGIDKTASLRIKRLECLEMCTGAGSIYAPFLTPAFADDPLARGIVREFARTNPHAYPANFNEENRMSRGIFSTLGNVLGGLGVPIVRPLGHAIDGLLGGM